MLDADELARLNALLERFDLLAYREQILAAELDREGAAWRQVMRLESNPVTTYTSPCDAAPVYVMAKDPGVRPWVPHMAVYGLACQ